MSVKIDQFSIATFLASLQIGGFTFNCQDYTTQIVGHFTGFGLVKSWQLPGFFSYINREHSWKPNARDWSGSMTQGGIIIWGLCNCSLPIDEVQNCSI